MDTAEQMQMAFMFEEGGIADDGMNVDPVSGNEIPPGSLAKEVRDDVPAQLSEGEYVVPADVVRYYGVKFFEDLRSEAKSGLMDMQANGRIGGEPTPMDTEDEDNALTPEELAAVQQLTSMYRGGVVKAAEGVSVDPNVPQFTQATGGAFAPGFLLQQQLQQPTTPAPATGVASQPTITTITLYGPNNEVLTLTLPTEQARYQQLLSQGYTTAPKSVSTESEPATARIEAEGPRIKDMNAEQLQDSWKKMQSSYLLSSVIGAFNPVMGLAVMGMNKLQKDQALKRAKDLGITLPEAEDGDGTVGGFITNLKNDLSNLFGTKPKEDKPISSPDLVNKAKEVRDAKAAKAAAEKAAAEQAAQQAAAATAAQQATAAARTYRDSSDNDSYSAVYATEKAKPGVTPGVAASTAAKVTANKAKLSTKDREGGAKLDTAFGISGLKDGGLIKKRNNK